MSAFFSSVQYGNLLQALSDIPVAVYCVDTVYGGHNNHRT